METYDLFSEWQKSYQRGVRLGFVDAMSQGIAKSQISQLCIGSGDYGLHVMASLTSVFELVNTKQGYSSVFQPHVRVQSIDGSPSVLTTGVVTIAFRSKLRLSDEASCRAQADCLNWVNSNVDCVCDVPKTSCPTLFAADSSQGSVHGLLEFQLEGLRKILGTATDGIWIDENWTIEEQVVSKLIGENQAAKGHGIYIGGVAGEEDVVCWKEE